MPGQEIEYIVKKARQDKCQGRLTRIIKNHQMKPKNQRVYSMEFAEDAVTRLCHIKHSLN